MSAGHVVVQPGDGIALTDWFMQQSAIKRQAETSTFSFLSQASLVVGTHRIATMHRRLALLATRFCPLPSATCRCPFRTCSKWCNGTSTARPTLAWCGCARCCTRPSRRWTARSRPARRVEQRSARQHQRRPRLQRRRPRVAALQVVVDQAHGLHEGVHRGGTHKAPAAFLRSLDKATDAAVDVRCARLRASARQAGRLRRARTATRSGPASQTLGAAPARGGRC